MQNIPLTLLRCWESLPVWGAVKESWDWHSREESEAGKEGEKGRLRQNRSQQNIKTSLDLLAASNDVWRIA
jgi:hypothetical protein